MGDMEAPMFKLISRRAFLVVAVLMILSIMAFSPALAHPAVPVSPPGEGSPWAFDVGADRLLAIAAAILSLAFNYAPGLAEWYDDISEIGKRQIMAALIILGAVGVFLGQCFNIFYTNLACTQAGALDMAYYIFLAAGVNQGVHLMTRPSISYKIKNFKSYADLGEYVADGEQPSS